MLKRRWVSVAASGALVATVATAPLMTATTANAADAVTVDHDSLVLDAPFEATHWSEVWDLTQGDATVRYTIDMTGIVQPESWPTGWVESPPGSGNWVFDNTPTTNPARYPDTYTPWVEVGMRGVGGSDYNPGPANTYQGKCGGWMTSESDDWLGARDENGVLVNDGPNTQDGDDKHSLAATSGVGEWHYDVEDGDGTLGYDTGWDSVQPMFGSHDNHGLWYDRDGVDQWQATSWENSGANAGRINTGGVYDIVIRYHAIDEGLGVMFATVNGVQQGFYKPSWHGGGLTLGDPDRYPAGLSFKGDMKQMQLFAGIYAPNDPAGHDYGSVALSDISVTGIAGVADPLVPDFTATFGAGNAVTFDASATHGGYATPQEPYTFKWDFDNNGTVDETSTNPVVTHTYPPGMKPAVKLTVNPARCNPYSVVKYPWIIRKDVLLYWQGHNVNYTDPSTVFTVDMYKGGPKDNGGVFVKTFTISESAPMELMLGLGEYYFYERDLPDGYSGARAVWYINETGGARHRDMSLENLIAFDLAVEKTGPLSAEPGETITYEYVVTNAGPAVVTPVLTDDNATPGVTSDDYKPSYVSGDANSDGKIQVTETWKYSSTYVVPAGAAGTDIVNVATVKDAEDDYGDGWKEGGDSDLTNNTDSWTVPVTAPVIGKLDVVKFYDANANGVRDTGEVSIPNWKFTIDGQAYFTGTPVDLPVGSYTVNEVMPTQTCWMSTTPRSVGGVEVTDGNTTTVSFGNLCLGAGGGLTPGYWSNRNGQTGIAAMGTDAVLAELRGLNLKGVSGATFDPATYRQLKDWLTARNAVDMRYQASAHLAAMFLNIRSGSVNPDALVYAGPELGFRTVSSLVRETNTVLAQPSPDRTYLGQLKSALDRANNNLSFVQTTPCRFSY